MEVIVTFEKYRAQFVEKLKEKLVLQVLIWFINKLHCFCLKGKIRAYKKILLLVAATLTSNSGQDDPPRSR